MRHKVLTSALKCALICETDITFTVSLMFNFFLSISLLRELVDNDGSDNIAKQNFKEAPVN